MHNLHFKIVASGGVVSLCGWTTDTAHLEIQYMNLVLAPNAPEDFETQVFETQDVPQQFLSALDKDLAAHINKSECLLRDSSKKQPVLGSSEATSNADCAFPSIFPGRNGPHLIGALIDTGLLPVRWSHAYVMISGFTDSNYKGEDVNNFCQELRRLVQPSITNIIRRKGKSEISNTQEIVFDDVKLGQNGPHSTSHMSGPLLLARELQINYENSFKWVDMQLLIKLYP